MHCGMGRIQMHTAAADLTSFGALFSKIRFPAFVLGLTNFICCFSGSSMAAMKMFVLRSF
jgi:hypothetical protein